MAVDRLLETLTLRKNGPNIGPTGWVTQQALTPTSRYSIRFGE